MDPNRMYWTLMGLNGPVWFVGSLTRLCLGAFMVQDQFQSAGPASVQSEPRTDAVNGG